MPKAITNAFVYAGFQCVTMPTMVACATPLPNSKGCKKAMWISFAMNAVVLVLSVFMLLTWKDVYTGVDGGTVIPTLTSCNAMSINWLTTIYGVCLLLCLISTGVTTIFGFVTRFEKLEIFQASNLHRSEAPLYPLSNTVMATVVISALSLLLFRS